MNKYKLTLRAAFFLPWLATIPLHANLLTNGNFGTGNLTGWTSTADWSVSDGVIGGDYSSTNPLPGGASYTAETGCEGSTCISTPTSSLSQTISTVIGQTYLFSFYYTSTGQIYEDGASMPNDLQAMWGNTQVANIVNQPGNGVWEYFSKDITATSTSTEIQFNGLDDPAFVYVTDVSVSAVPEPSTLPLTSAGAGILLTVLYLRRRANRISSCG